MARNKRRTAEEILEDGKLEFQEGLKKVLKRIKQENIILYLIVMKE